MSPLAYPCTNARSSSAGIDPPSRFVATTSRPSPRLTRTSHRSSSIRYPRRLLEAEARGEARSGHAVELDAEKVGDRRPEVRERVPGSDVERPGGQTGGEDRRPLAGVIRGRCRRIASMVARQDEDSAVEARDDLREPPVERLDRARIPVGVVAMPVFAVEVDEVREHERRPGPLQVSDGLVDAVVVRG